MPTIIDRLQSHQTWLASVVGAHENRLAKLEAEVEFLKAELAKTKGV